MSLYDRVAHRSARAFIPGEAVVERTDTSFGHDDTKFSPAAYGDYLATSNPVYACVNLRANLLASLPLKLMNGENEITAGPARELFDKVNPFWTFQRLLYMTELSLGLWGESYWVLDRGQSHTGRPTEIWWVKPTLMKVVPHATDYIAGFILDAQNGTDPIFFTPGEVLWLRYPNPLDEFAGLSPVAAARLAADLESASAKSNANLFRQGMQVGGIISPADRDVVWSEEQARVLEEGLSRRLKGVDKAHRWAVLREQLRVESMSVTPKDAEFVGTLSYGLHAVCRAYGVPVELLSGENRTYENFSTALRAVWELTVAPEAKFISSEITEQVMPMFGGGTAGFSFDDVKSLQEDEAPFRDFVLRAWDSGLVGERTASELVGVEFAADDRRKLPVNVGLVDMGADVQPADESEPVSDQPAQSAVDLAKVLARGGAERETPPRVSDPSPLQGGASPAQHIPWRSAAHEDAWARFDERALRHEAEFGRLVEDLMVRQRDEVLERLPNIVLPVRAIEPLEPFDLTSWITEFIRFVNPVYRKMIRDSARDALRDLAVGISFDLENPRVARYVRRRAQRFATEVNETTWRMLRESLAAGLELGESIDALGVRVQEVMGRRIRSSREAIARTEAISATNQGTLEGWSQSGVVERKAWLASLDARVRDSHADAHRRYQSEPIPLDEAFEVGGASGMTPGNMSSAKESVNCRCTVTPVVSDRTSNGAHRRDLERIRSRLSELTTR